MHYQGLTDEEVRISREQNGSNTLTEIETESFWEKFIGNFDDPIIKILCVALIINVIFVFTGKAEWYETLGIAVAVLLATLVATFSEYKNENAFQKLQEESSKIKCKVFRNGDIVELSIDDIVVGDYVLLQSGDKIPADGSLLEGCLKVDQSVLNGETKEACKNPAPADMTIDACAMDFLDEFKLFRGTTIYSGNAVQVVNTVGDKTVYGQIASELQTDEDRESPLKVKLQHLADGISKFGYIGGVAIAVAFLFKKIVMDNGFDSARIMSHVSDLGLLGNDIVQAIILAVIIIVMAVPEGLPLMIAIVSSLNMSKMLKDNVLVRKITGIETAGSLNILFSDKTGTITKGQLEAMIFLDGQAKEYSHYCNVLQELSKLLTLSIHKNTNAVISGSGENIKIVGGNATERAILKFASQPNSDFSVAEVNSIPFSSDNKYSATQVKGDYNLTLIKGAPEKVLYNCKTYFDDSGNKHELKDHSILDQKINELAGRSIRVLALAATEADLVDDKLPEGDWTLVGIIGIRDELRPQSKGAIEEVNNAGVQVVMITGDRKDTAVAIAKEAGLIKKETDRVLTSDDLGKMTDDEIKTILKDIRVIARALPSDKSRLVRVAQELNLVVGMTGDGVNDAPALKKADVGFAMGDGTEVAKEASDIVIMDNNFSSIDKAILYGRTIFNSIRKFIIFQLTINVAAVLISFIAPLIGMENPLSIIQILWVNLVMDTLAALAFGGEPALRRFMQEKPKKRTEPIVSPYMWSSILTVSIWVFIISLFMLRSDYGISHFRTDGAHTMKYLLTGYFTFFIFAAVFNAFNARTDQFNLLDNIGKNKGFLNVMLLIVAVQILMTNFGGPVLHCYGLTGIEWAFVIIAALTVIPIDLIKKLFFLSKKEKE